MATFVIETFIDRARGTEELRRAAGRLRTAILATPSSDPRRRLVRSYYVPEDEFGLHLVEASSSDDVLALCREARLVPERIVEAEPASVGTDGVPPTQR